MLTKNHSSTEAISLLANLKFDERINLMEQLNVVDERYHTLTDEELMKKILYIAFIIYHI